jgi:hypothetical protein
MFMATNRENQHQFEDEAGKIVDKNLAEGMAYAEKPYRDESLRRKKENQAEYDYVFSDAYKEDRRAEENAFLDELVDFDDQVKKQKILKRFKKFTGRELSISETKLDRLVSQTREIVHQRWVANAAERQAREQAIIPTGIKKAEDYKKTYVRRFNQQPLSGSEAVKEGALVMERAREEAEAKLKYAELLKDFEADLRHLGWEQLQEFNTTRNFLNRPLDKSIKAEDYEEALEHIERLKEVPAFNLSAWFIAQLELKALEIKECLRRRKQGL